MRLVTKVEKRHYCLKRLSKAVDRQLTSNSESKKNADFWAKVWALKFQR